MLGKTHLKLGIITALTTTALINIDSYNALELVGAMTISSAASVLTSQLPDLDSETSKISKKIPIINYLKNKTGIITDAIITIITLCLYIYYKNNILAWCTLFFGFLVLFKLLIRFLFRHRTFTHSLFAIGLLSFPCIYSLQFTNSNQVYYSFIIGLITGYVSHIFFDCLTVKGSNLLWPITDKKISLWHWKSGEDDDKCIVITSIISCLLIVHPLYLPYIQLII